MKLRDRFFQKVKRITYQFTKFLDQGTVITDKLGIRCTVNAGWIGGRWKLKNASGGYHGILKVWWEHFGLKGEGLIIGESGKFGDNTKAAFQKEYPEIKFRTVDLGDADIVWDITEPYGVPIKVDCIICQSVLEHVGDPAAAIRNMATLLKSGGMLYVETAGPSAPHHEWPIDCFRFFPMAFVVMGEKANLQIEDILCLRRHCLVAYRRR